MSLNVRQVLSIGLGAAILSVTAFALASTSSTSKVTYGKSYVVKGKRYHPYKTVSKGFSQVGTASWYDVASNFGTHTASGQILNGNALTAASPLLPMHTKVKVTNLKNKKSVIVTINDRGPYRSDFGPYKSKRIIDLTHAAAKKLGYVDAGTTKVKVTVLS